MRHLIYTWILNALALWLVARIIKGIEVSGFAAALVGAFVIAVVNFFLGPIFRFFSFPLIIITFGLFSLVINAFLLKLAAMFTPGFKVHGFLAAFLGSIVLTVVTMVFHALVIG